MNEFRNGLYLLFFSLIAFSHFVSFAGKNGPAANCFSKCKRPSFELKKKFEPIYRFLQYPNKIYLKYIGNKALFTKMAFCFSPIALGLLNSFIDKSKSGFSKLFLDAQLATTIYLLFVNIDSLGTEDNSDNSNDTKELKNKNGKNLKNEIIAFKNRILFFHNATLLATAGLIKLVAKEVQMPQMSIGITAFNLVKTLLNFIYQSNDQVFSLEGDTTTATAVSK